MAKQIKTNAVRLLEAAGIPHSVLVYDPSDGRIDAASVAEKLGESPGALFKTLVARAERNIYVFCIPGNAELDLKKAARAAGQKKIELIAVKELLPLTGYVRGGCSPLGMKKAYPLFVDADAGDREYIVISGGALGIQIRLGPGDLLTITGAATADLIQALDR
jgi:Cys-tRNA(Pro)/Cys-tRNA(Cys) deacylase